MNPRWIIGLAPGSSLYGVDAVLAQVHGAGYELAVRPVHTAHLPYPRDLRNLMLRLQSGAPTELKFVSLLHRLLGETFAVAARLVADRASFSLQQVLCVGCPGHTIWQEPDARYPSLFEAGMCAVVAERVGLTTISDFRMRDLAAGGVGVPVEALADWLLFRHPRETRALVHLGGTATAVFLPAGTPEQEVTGGEIGPCTLLLDSLVWHLSGGREGCDAGGKQAVQGRCLDELLDSWLEHSWWQRRTPRGLTPATFGDAFAVQAVKLARQRQWERHDLLCTATHLVARGIGLALRRARADGQLPERVLLSGGGVRNGFLWQLLEQQLAGTILEKTDALGVAAEFRRALAFAVLAALTVDGVPASVPSVTGASGARLLGSVTPGSPANWARCLAWMASQSALGYRVAG